MSDEYHFMGDMSREEFRRMTEMGHSESPEDFKRRLRKIRETIAKEKAYQEQKRRERKEQDYVRRHQNLWESEPVNNNYHGTVTGEGRKATCDFNRLSWEIAFRRNQVRYIRDYARDEITFEATGFHRQTFQMSKLISEYVHYIMRIKKLDWNAAARIVGTEDNVLALFNYTIDTGQFPYPYEVATGIRRHFIDLKQVLIDDE